MEHIIWYLVCGIATTITGHYLRQEVKYHESLMVILLWPLTIALVLWVDYSSKRCFSQEKFEYYFKAPKGEEGND